MALPDKRAERLTDAEQLSGAAAEPPPAPRLDPDEPAVSAWEAGATWETLAGAAGRGDGAPVSETDSDDSLQPYDLSKGPDEGAALPCRPFHARQLPMPAPAQSAHVASLQYMLVYLKPYS